VQTLNKGLNLSKSKISCYQETAIWWKLFFTSRT